MGDVNADPEGGAASAEHARVGVVVGGKYRLDRLLGAGGMGAVYDAQHTWTHRRVAVKVLRSEYSRNRDAANRFLQEARTAAGINHPNIVQVLDMGESDDGALYLVQEFLDGTDLREHLLQHGRLSPRQAIEILLPVAEAVAAANARGIVHRDLKPANIFLTRDPNGGFVPKVIDFGISKVIDPTHDQPLVNTNTGMMIGTPSYMSPEQARGDRDIDGRSDVWSLGVVIYEVIAGRGPFEAENYNLTILRLMTQDAPPLHTFIPDVPQELSYLVQRTLIRERERRVASAQLLAAGLRSWQTTAAGLVGETAGMGQVRSVDSHRPMPTLAPAEATPPARPSRRATAFVAYGVAAIAIAIAAVVAFSWVRSGSSLEHATATPGVPAGKNTGSEPSRADSPALPPVAAPKKEQPAAAAAATTEPAIGAFEGTPTRPTAVRPKSPRKGKNNAPIVE